MTSDIIHGSRKGVAWRPIVRRGGMPLRVAVYSEIARAIRAGELRPGEVLPREADLCDAFEVSRTVMREALILLEEDGLVRTQRGIGRFVADVLPVVGLERLQPIERMLERPHRKTAVRRIRNESEEQTDFTRRGLELDPDAPVRFWESVVTHDGDPVALTQEWVPDGPALASFGARVVGAVQDRAREPESLLAALAGALGPALGPGVCEVSVSNAGSERAHPLGIKGTEPVVLLNQTVSLEARPIYLAKHLVRPEAVHLRVTQSSQS